MKNIRLKYGLHFRCGNSSGVEHNLAKVGVASSNLVSRSIFLISLFLFPFQIFANEINKIPIYPMYCVKNDAIMLSTFGFGGEDNEILNLGGARAAKIDIKKLNEILTANFKTYSDKSGGSVAFVKDCSQLDLMQASFLRAVSDEYAGIVIENLSIEPQNALPENFENFRFKSIFLNGASNQRGSFRASFELPDLTLKSLFFKYSFKAKMPVFIALNDIESKRVLGLLDYQSGFVDFEKYQKDALAVMPASALVARSKIKAGEVLMKHNFAAVTLVKKGDALNAVLNDGGLSVIIEVRAMEGGNLGDAIKVKNKDGKILSAIVSSPKEVVLK